MNDRLQPYIKLQTSFTVNHSLFIPASNRFLVYDSNHSLCEYDLQGTIMKLIYYSKLVYKVICCWIDITLGGSLQCNTHDEYHQKQTPSFEYVYSSYAYISNSAVVVHLIEKDDTSSLKVNQWFPFWWLKWCLKSNQQLMVTCW